MRKKKFEEAVPEEMQDPFEKAVAEQLRNSFGFEELGPGRVKRNPRRNNDKVLAEMVDMNSILPKQTYIKQKSGRNRKRGPRGY